MIKELIAVSLLIYKSNFTYKVVSNYQKSRPRYSNLVCNIYVLHICIISNPTLWFDARVLLIKRSRVS